MYVTIPAELRKDALINAAIRTVVQEFSPKVKHIRYNIGKDWSDEWAIFFRIVISDEVAARSVRQRVEFKNSVTNRMMEELDLPNLDMWPHFDYRSESEQSARNDPDWAPVA
jgi:hypothetical protein